MLERPKFIVLALFCLLGWTAPAVAQQAELPTPLSSNSERAGYAIGRQIGGDFLNGGLDASLIDLRALVLGIQDALAAKESRVPEAEIREAMQRVQQVASSKVEKRVTAASEKSRQAAAQFVAKYKTMKGVQSLPSGVLYTVRKAGNGPSPKATDQVKTHYRGRLVDGTEFDSSYKRKEPAVFPVNGVIRGWTEALQKMKVGDQWQLVIPPELAYGKRGSPPVIPPDATLVFDIELLDIVKDGSP